MFQEAIIWPALQMKLYLFWVETTKIICLITHPIALIHLLHLDTNIIHFLNNSIITRSEGGWQIQLLLFFKRDHPIPQIYKSVIHLIPFLIKQ